MTDERDPFVADALRRLADRAPQPRADRLVAVAIGAHRRHQNRVTASTIGAVGVVVAAALGVHTWTNTSASVSHPTHTGSAPPSVVASSPAPASSEPQSSTTDSAASAPSGPPAAHAAASVPAVKVSAPAAGSTGDPVTFTVTVTNKGTATTHGGTVSLAVGFTADGASQGSSSIDFSGFSAGCQSVSSGLLCDVGTLRPGQSAVFSQSITPRGTTNSVTFNATWRYTAPGGATVVTPFHRVVVITPGIPSSQEPVSSNPPSSIAPSVTPSAS